MWHDLIVQFGVVRIGVTVLLAVAGCLVLVASPNKLKSTVAIITIMLMFAVTWGYDLIMALIKEH
jgi:hypothetical protein